jgi:hypothetical protein
MIEESLGRCWFVDGKPFGLLEIEGSYGSGGVLWAARLSLRRV